MPKRHLVLFWLGKKGNTATTPPFTSQLKGSSTVCPYTDTNSSSTVVLTHSALSSTWVLLHLQPLILKDMSDTGKTLTGKTDGVFSSDISTVKNFPK